MNYLSCIIISSLAYLTISSPILTQKECLAFNDKLMDQPIDYLNVPGPIGFDSAQYFLKWSSNPLTGYYKQEYLQKKDDFTNFNKMLLLEYADGISTENAINIKIRELEIRKKTDFAVNYQVNRSPDKKQYIIDFIISDKNIYELNIYKYIPVKKSGKEIGNILLAAVVRSSEKTELTKDKFYEYVKLNRIRLINEMIKMEVPVIQVMSSESAQ